MGYKIVKCSEGEYVGQLNWRKLAHGEGVLYLRNGDEISGDWVNGELHGHATYTWANGDQLSAMYSHGNLCNGKAYFFPNSGGEYEVTIVNGEITSKTRIG